MEDVNSSEARSKWTRVDNSFSKLGVRPNEQQRQGRQSSDDRETTAEIPANLRWRRWC
ncbi:hypothetical protein Syun_029910 [Stephania yunnanensis]|uniref:Uncharacterized protein n=1 Tax=Stephania yunnanensis TaxID=152371 RepID=A0AAP0E6H3_9MAGN